MKNHKLVSALVAIPLAIMLWLYVVTVVSPNSNRVIRDIPITFEGTILLEERELIMTEGGGTASLKLSGDRVNLSKLTSENVRVIADLSQASITTPGEYTVPLSVVLPTNSGKVTYDFVDKAKSQIDISVAKLVTKTVSVELDIGNEEAKDGYFFDSTAALADPAEITVSGPDFEIDTVYKAVIDCTDISKLEETVVEQRPILLKQEDGSLSDITNTTVSQTQATVSLPIQKYKQLTVSADFKDGGGAVGSNVSAIQFSPDTIIVRGSSNQIDNLDDVLVVGTIDLAKVIATNSTKSFPITLPNGIKNVNGVDEVTVSFTLVGLRTQSYLVYADRITLLNTPQNAKIEVNMEKIAVKLRGPEADIAAINADDIRISLDLSGVTKSGEVLASVSIDGYPDVAVIEDVFVDILVS